MVFHDDFVPQTRITSRVAGRRKFTSIKILAFALPLAFCISEYMTTDLIVNQTCKRMPDFNSTKCNILADKNESNNFTRMEKFVQPHTGTIFELKSCIEIIFSTIASLLLGSWSDRYGRKLVIIFSLAGHTLRYAVLAILSSYDVHPYWFLLSSLPVALSGGYHTIISIFFCYTTDTTDNQSRSWNMTVLETMLFMGRLAGFFIGPIIYQEFAYVGVFVTSEVLCLFGVIYTVLFVEETRRSKRQVTWKRAFDCTFIQESISAVLKKRDGFDRCLVGCCIVAVALQIAVSDGLASISFLFSSSALGWDISDYSIFVGARYATFIAGMLLFMKFLQPILKLSDAVIIILASLTSSVDSVLKAFARKSWHMYFSSGISMFSLTAGPVIRSVLSKSVPHRDVGKVFSFTTTIEMIVPLATTPLFIFIYTNTLNLYPYPVWFMSAALTQFMTILALVIGERLKRLANPECTPILANARC